MGSFTPAPTTALSPGDRLDRYELLCILAQGGMGTVWLARLTGKHGFERLVALKTILPSYVNDRQFCDMFLDEARIASSVDHENVARVLEIGEDRGVLYQAMELVDGESLRKLYRDVRTVGAPFPLGVALRIAADVCAGLHAVHELRDQDGRPLEVVHRDVSPQNILITIRGTVKLIDFGVAKANQRRTEETTAGTLKGKIEYMAPEQASGEPMDRRADVYAVGAVLYELLSGEPVRNTDDGRQLLALHELMTGAPYEPLRSSIPAPVRAVVDRALARDPQLRFRSTEDMRHALEQALLAIGQLVTTDDVANVLAHFSRERTQRRKDAIEAAFRAAQAMERLPPSSPRIGVPEPAPTGPMLPDPGAFALNELGVPRQSRGPKGTQVLMDQPQRMVGEGPTTGGSITGPSMRTMQGASISEYPQPRDSSFGKVFAALVVLAVVAVLGVIGGVVVSRNSMTPTAAGTGAAPMPIPVTTAVAPGAATTGNLMAADPPGGGPIVNPTMQPGIILGASDGGAGKAPVTTPATPPKKPTTPAGKGEKRPGKSESGDEYGF